MKLKLKDKKSKINSVNNNDKNKEKLGTLKSRVPTKISKNILWVLLIFFFVKGVIASIRPDPTKKILDEVNERIKISQSDSNEESIVRAFAEAFSMEYFTYNAGKSEEYTTRLGKFMSVEAIGALSSSISVDSKSISAIAINIEKQEEENFNVTVQAKVNYQNGDKDRFIIVPVKYIENNCIVDDIPLFVSSPELPYLDQGMLDGVLAESTTSREIETMLKSFLKVYTSGEEGEIKYYLTEDIRLSGLRGAFTFKSLSDLRVYIDESKNDSYIALVNYFVEDNDNKNVFKQRVKLDIKYKDNRYYISKLDTRGK